MIEAGGAAGASPGAVLKTLHLSDLVGSTELLERLGDQRAFRLFGRHDRLARDLLSRHSGREIDKTDGFLLLFERPIDAVLHAQASHEALAALGAEEGVELAARVGIHVGEVYLRANPPEDVARGAKPVEVEGMAKPVAARLMSLAQGRQPDLRSARREHRLRAVPRPEHRSYRAFHRHPRPRQRPARGRQRPRGGGDGGPEGTAERCGGTREARGAPLPAGHGRESSLTPRP